MGKDRTERYLRRATRGLWGQARRDAVAELRGAIDDKLYRLTLLGLTGEVAPDRALGELGDPRQLARGYAQVHSLPPALRAAVLVLLGSAAILSFSLAQQVLQAVPYQLRTESCDFSEAGLRGRSAAEVTSIRKAFTIFGGQQATQRACQASQQGSNQYLKVENVVLGLKASGVKVRLDASPRGYTFTFPGPQAAAGFLSLDQPAEQFGSEEYMPLVSLLNMLQSLPEVPLRLRGERNPELSAGPVTLRLGSDQAPVWASAIYGYVVQDDVFAKLRAVTSAGRPEIIPYDFDLNLGKSVQTLGVARPGMYALINTNDKSKWPVLCACDYLLRVQRAANARLRLPVYDDPQRAVTLVGTYRDLAAAQARDERAVLVLRLNDSGDLRNLNPAPVAANLIHLEAPR